MKLFFTTATQHLRTSIAGTIGACTIKTFADGELYVRIDEDVAHQEVCVVASTGAPAEHIIELFFLLDALERAQARIFVVLTYCGYARQDRAQIGEVLSTQVMARFFSTTAIQKLSVIHIHSIAAAELLQCAHYIPYSFFDACAQLADIIVAPDQGAYTWAVSIAQDAELPIAVMQKHRISPDQTEIKKLEGDVRGKSVLIVDDMISTASTIIQASYTLQHAGATHIMVAATHGLFAHDALAKIAESPINKVYVTNTLAQHREHPSIQVVDIGSYIEHVILSR